MKRTLRPDRLLREVLGVGWARKNILGRDYSLKNEVKRAILKADVMTERQLDSMADKVTDFYISKAERLQAEGIKAYRKEAINNEKMMKERVEMAVTYYEVDREAKAHAGGFYRWLPSEAKEPEPEHALLYGKVFKVGEGDKDGNMPMQRYGCKCGIEWLSDETAEKELPENKPVEAVKEDIETAVDMERFRRSAELHVNSGVWTVNFWQKEDKERIYINLADRRLDDDTVFYFYKGKDGAAKTSFNADYWRGRTNQFWDAVNTMKAMAEDSSFEEIKKYFEILKKRLKGA